MVLVKPSAALISPIVQQQLVTCGRPVTRPGWQEVGHNHGIMELLDFD
jgi:hypothetical protein